ncbi:MAG: hypothetical protein WC130_03685 [Kiritimatiellia bacterium]
MTVGERIVAAILNDLTDRKGIGDEWEAIEDDIQREIIEGWAAIADKMIKNYGSKK